MGTPSPEPPTLPLARPAVGRGHPAAWLALLVAGQAATLQWVEAGPRVAYQHYLPIARLWSDAPSWSLLVVLLEVIAVLVSLGAARPVLATLFPATARWRLFTVAIGFFLTSATLSREPAVYVEELVLATLVQLLHALTVLLLVASLAGLRAARFGAALDRWIGPREPAGSPVELGGLDRFAWLVALASAAVAAGLAVWCYQRHPHIPDEVVYLIQARYLAAGHLSLPLPPVAEAFNVDLMFSHLGRWFSPVPPGWPLILAVGVALGAPWLVNPVLSGVNILLAYLLLRELYPRRTARIAVILLAVSPWQLFMAMNLMTHTASLTAALVAAVALARMRRHPSPWIGIIAGVGIGVVGLIRPLEGVAVALVLGLWSLRVPGRRFRFGPSTVVTLATLATSAVVLPYNRALMGSARSFPIMAYTDAVFGPGTNALGFGPNRGLGWPGLDPLPGHGPIDVLINANLNLFQVNIELLGWATGSLVVLGLLVLVGRLRAPDWGMLGVIAMVAGIHSFYYFAGGPDFGARYWYLILVPCMALAARGLVAWEATTAQRAADRGPLPLAAATALTVASVVVFMPWRATDKYYHYRGMRPDLRAVAYDPAMANSVLLIRGHRHPDFASAAAYNPLDLSGDGPIFAWDRGGPVRRELVEAYPGRRFYVVEGPTVTGGSFRIAAGPLSGEALLARRDSTIPEP